MAKEEDNNLDMTRIEPPLTDTSEHSLYQLSSEEAESQGKP